VISGAIKFLDLDDGKGGLALYKVLALAGVYVGLKLVSSGAFWPAVTLYIAILAASFGRNTFLKFLERNTTTITGRFDTTLTGNVRDLHEGVEPAP
jgi:hypothetical protein